MGIGDMAKDLFDKAKDVVEDVMDGDTMDKVKDTLGDAKDKLSATFADVTGGAKDGIDHIQQTDEAQIDLDGAGEKAKDAFADATSTAEDKLVDAKDAAADFADDAKDRVADAADDARDAADRAF